MRPGVRARSSEGCSVVRRPSGTETGVAAHRHARRMPAGAIPVEAEGPGLVERGPEGHAVAQRAEHGAREGQVVRDDALAQPAAVAVLQHLRRPAPAWSLLGACLGARCYRSARLQASLGRGTGAGAAFQRRSLQETQTDACRG